MNIHVIYFVFISFIFWTKCINYYAITLLINLISFFSLSFLLDSKIWINLISFQHLFRKRCLKWYTWDPLFFSISFSNNFFNSIKQIKNFHIRTFNLRFSLQKINVQEYSMENIYLYHERLYWKDLHQMEKYHFVYDILFHRNKHL